MSNKTYEVRVISHSGEETKLTVNTSNLEKYMQDYQKSGKSYSSYEVLSESIEDSNSTMLFG